MKFVYFSLWAFIVCLVVSSSMAMSLHPYSPGEIILDGHLNQSCIPHRGGTVFLQMQLNARDYPLPDRCYSPMNISIVLDRSGSMADERKITYAKQAVADLVDRLTPADYLSIVIYDDKIETLLPTQHITDRRRIKRLIEEISPRGSTNLGGGMQEGFRLIERNFKSEYVNRVILLSDGLANQGIVDPYELGRIAADYRRRGISLSTMGVGLDYNENLMLGLAEHGGGNYYFVESPSQLASMFDKELNGLNYVVAQNAHIELILGNGVRVADVIGCEHRQEGELWLIPVGDISANEHREFTVELTVPEGTGTRHIVSGSLKFDGERTYRCAGFSLDIRYSDVTAEMEKSKDWDTQAKVDVAVSTRQVDKAMDALDAGHEEEAVQVLNEARLMLQSAPSVTNSAAASPMIQEQIGQLQKYSQDLKDERLDKRKVKKSMQYNNYRTQKKKE